MSKGVKYKGVDKLVQLTNNKLNILGLLTTIFGVSIDIYCIFAYNNNNRIHQAYAVNTVCSNVMGHNLRGVVIHG